jgi:hypothetical protein
MAKGARRKVHGVRLTAQGEKLKGNSRKVVKKGLNTCILYELEASIGKALQGEAIPL